MDRGLIDAIRQLLRARLLSVALVTVLTLGIVAAVVLTTTPAGCGLGVKTARCLNTGGVASHTSPSPSVGTLQSPVPTIPPYNPGASSPPYNPGASSYPPYDSGSSAGNPNPGPASGSYPPLASPTSGSSAPALAIACRLPVYANGPGSGGFIVFPGGTFVADPRSAVMVPSPPPGSPTPTPPSNGMGGPVYAGWFGSTYDAAYSKWLPVGWRWVSPDGAHYAYPLNGDIFVQSVAGGPQLDLARGQGLTVLDVDNAGVYAIKPNAPGLWYLPFSGTEKQVSASDFWQGASHGFAYGTITASVPFGATTTILRLDVARGTKIDYFSQQGGTSSVTGFDLQGHPIVQVNYQGGAAMYVVTGPNTWTAIAGTSDGYGQFPYGQVIADGHGLWWGGGGIILFANGAWYFMSSLGAQIAGPCV